jgi:hypothetical protein
MIHVNYQGRFGNNLFQYFTALILSNKFNQAIINILPNNIFEYNNTNLNIDYKKNLIIDDNNIYDIFQHETLNSNLILNGFFQNKFILKLFNENRDIIKKNIQRKSEEGVFVHVRLGDKINTNCGIKYYQKSLKNLKGGYISSDSINHDIIKQLSDKFELKIFENSPEETIIYGSRFKNKVLSLGTFSWWIGFLGNQNNVMCPVQKEYEQWHGDIFPFLNWKEVSILS